MYFPKHTIMTREVLFRHCFLRSCHSLRFFSGVISNHEREPFSARNFATIWVSDLLFKHCGFVCSRYFCAGIQQGRICWGGSSQEVLLRKIEIALNDHQVDEAWEVFNDFKSLYGFPVDSLVVKMISVMSYSNKRYWLQKACNLVIVVLDEKSSVVKSDLLTKLSLSLARAQMPIPASMMLRLMLEKNMLLPMNVLQLVFLHLVKTESGTCLASNFLIQLCDRFIQLAPNRSYRAKLAKPDTMIFNIVLDACVRFESSIKGQQLIELMSQLGVIADAHSIILVAMVYEMNGHRDEMKRLKTYVDRVPSLLVCHYRQFYDSMLSLHFKFDDIDAAAQLVLNIYRQCASPHCQKNIKDSQSQKPYLVPIGSQNIRNGLKIQIMPELLQIDSVLKVEGKQEFVMFLDEKLVPRNKALAKLVKGYREHGNISELSRLLLNIQKEFYSCGGWNICAYVTDACIHLGWLETAHDILDDMESAGTPMGFTTYMSLLRAYCKADMPREVTALVKQMRKAGLVVNMTGEMVVSTFLTEVADGIASNASTSSLSCNSDLAECLAREVREIERVTSPKVYELDSSIFFFCKAKMIGDALKTYRKMQKMNVKPTIQTFANLTYGFSSLEMYRDITIMWGDIKRNIKRGTLLANRDLFELLLLNFIRGGYFERVMEIINEMKVHHMFVDHLMYKSEFLKFHKNLYRNLKQSQARTEAQSKRLEFVRAFRKWVGID